MPTTTDVTEAAPPLVLDPVAAAAAEKDRFAAAADELEGARDRLAAHGRRIEEA